MLARVVEHLSAPITSQTKVGKCATEFPTGRPSSSNRSKYRGTPSIGRYPYAIVTDVKKCNDGLVRAVTVKMADGRTRERDISKLVLIEAANHKVEEAKLNDSSDCAGKTGARKEYIGVINIHDDIDKEEEDTNSDDEIANMDCIEKEERYPRCWLQNEIGGDFADEENVSNMWCDHSH